MTAFKPGDRVHVEFDAEVSSLQPPTREYDLAMIVVPGKDHVAYAAPTEWLTLIRPPLAVGDVLTADDPEPPKGTVLMDGGTIWRRLPSDGRWYAPGDTGAYEWHRVRPVGSVVLYVPEDTP